MISDKIKIKTVKKYLFISSKEKLILLKINLFIKMFLGLLNKRIWLIEYLNKEYILTNLNPELVEKKEPPIITMIKNKNDKFFCSISIEKPILEMLLVIASKFGKKSLLKLKKRKKIDIIIK
tara:strand:+ start:226 stop:591 length:366 start_codon:yes stop_codon:yes gene_type:complete